MRALRVFGRNMSGAAEAIFQFHDERVHRRGQHFGKHHGHVPELEHHLPRAGHGERDHLRLVVLRAGVAAVAPDPRPDRGGRGRGTMVRRGRSARRGR